MISGHGSVWQLIAMQHRAAVERVVSVTRMRDVAAGDDGDDDGDGDDGGEPAPDDTPAVAAK